MARMIGTYGKRHAYAIIDEAVDEDSIKQADRRAHVAAWKIVGIFTLWFVLAFTSAWGRILWNTWQYENGNAAMALVPREFFPEGLRVKPKNN